MVGAASADGCGGFRGGSSGSIESDRGRGYSRGKEDQKKLVPVTCFSYPPQILKSLII